MGSVKRAGEPLAGGRPPGSGAADRLGRLFAEERNRIRYLGKARGCRAEAAEWETYARGCVSSYDGKGGRLRCSALRMLYCVAERAECAFYKGPGV